METGRPRRRRVPPEPTAPIEPAQAIWPDASAPRMGVSRRAPIPAPKQPEQPEWKRRALEAVREEPKAQTKPAQQRSTQRKPAAQPRPAARQTSQPPRQRTQAYGAPRAAQPRAAKPRTVQPQAAQPRTAQPRTAQRQPARAGYAQSVRYGAPPQKRRGNGGRRGARALILLVLVAVLTGVGAGGLYVLDVRNTLALGEGVFYPNLYINDINIGGMTQQQAYDAVSAQVTQALGTWAVSVVLNGSEVTRITPSTINMRYDVGDQINQLWNVGRTGTSQERYRQVKALQSEPERRYTTLAYDLSPIDALLYEIKSQVDTPAVDAQRVTDETKVPPFSYVQEQVGYSLDTTQAHEEIVGMIDRLESGTVTLTPQTLQPSVTVAQLQNEIVLLASFSTPLRNTSSNTEGRLANVAKGCSYFNGMVVEDGQKVSFNTVTGRREQSTGWFAALEIAYGEYVEGYGGGICQVSSTLYNAVIGAGLEIVSRTNHGLVVGYLDMGLDATVGNNGPDFVFRNNTGAPIYIEAYSEGKGGNCVFRIYGRPDPNGYSYKLESQVAETIPYETEYRIDKEGTYVTYGQEPYVYRKGADGYKVDVYKVTYQNGTPVERVLAYTDTYKPTTQICYQGDYTVINSID